MTTLGSVCVINPRRDRARPRRLRGLFSELWHHAVCAWLLAGLGCGRRMAALMWFRGTRFWGLVLRTKLTSQFVTLGVLCSRARSGARAHGRAVGASPLATQLLGGILAKAFSYVQLQANVRPGGLDCCACASFLLEFASVPSQQSIRQCLVAASCCLQSQNLSTRTSSIFFN